MNGTTALRLRLNLGPLGGADARRSGLNLGVYWDDDAPEPVIRGVRQGASIAWTSASRLGRLSSSMRWQVSANASVAVHYRWGDSPRAHRQSVVSWGLSGSIHGEAGFRWRTGMGLMGSKWRTGWGALAQEGRLAQLSWGAAMLVLSRSCAIPMRWLAAGASSYSMRWRSRGPWTESGRSMVWANSAIGRASAWLPWGAARRVPWGVRPGPGPGPDPDPDPTFPPGNRVGLNLGCAVIGVPGLAPLNLGISACYVVRPQRRTYVVINEVSFVRLPDRVQIELARVSLSAGRSAWGWTFDIELADADQLGLLKPTASGPRQFELVLNGYVWTGIIESFQKQREFAGGGVRLSGRSRTALLAPPYAPARVKATTEERSMAQLVAEELTDTGFASQYDTVDWSVPPGSWFYDASTPLDAISTLASASGGVVQSHPSDLTLVVRASYPASPWLWRETTPNHVLQEDIVLTESLQMRSAPLYDAVVVTGELAGKGVTCKVRKAGEAGQLFAQQVSSPLINVAAAAAERGRNILCDRGEQAAVDLTVPLFPKPLKAGEIGVILPLDLVQVLSSEGTWHGQCESIRIEVVVDQQAVVIEQTATLERHFTDAD
ncbi:hypothetical protein I5V61_20925 [Stenotrophomonas maltophilia]|nr:hypothetical protein [Stenotrophomonas maltophilia]